MKILHSREEIGNLVAITATGAENVKVATTALEIKKMQNLQVQQYAIAMAEGYLSDMLPVPGILSKVQSAKAKELAGKVGGQAITFDELKDFHPEEGMILANTTSVGMKPRIEDSPLPKEALKHYSLVFDAIYTPKWTRLLQEAKECGAIVVFGTEMFINQAFVQVERFTGLPAPKQLMRDVLARNT
ncbi:bifunctional 3-dehydroquinate dehydratase/shikimate dehydrogenase, chloroplastic-like [Pistacia vera]|uniref:bifunctional 3-dehydroquinate dehydratase/shikimate dehydrogenase, chloroplastic-like n=1 Tax=Pistacia vera TaxID=55513 RepID=UPI00126383A7|nr:bifunctional 3-dehydroquinate dehydratase/shikimate dehydrogenase, chloroplastic-like [Pistacia vera]